MFLSWMLFFCAILMGSVVLTLVAHAIPTLGIWTTEMLRLVYPSPAEIALGLRRVSTPT
jgi:hypothetical protein